MEQKILIIHSTDRNIERNFWGYFFSHAEFGTNPEVLEKDIPNIYENNFGKNIPFGQMDILHVV